VTTSIPITGSVHTAAGILTFAGTFTDAGGATTKTLFGSCPDGFGAANFAALLAQQPAAQSVRCYNTPSQGAPAWPATSEEQYAPATLPLVGSCEPPLGSVASGASVAALKAWVGARSDIPGHVVTIWHEPENPSKPTGASPAAWSANVTAFVTNVVQPVNATRKNPIKTATILMCYTLTPAHPHGNPDTWYVPAVDLLGFDCYGQGQVGMARSYAASKGKPFFVGEYGPTIGATTTDAQVLAMVQADLPDLRTADRALWFDSGGYAFTSYPQTLAYWKTLEAS
jgi:hypothetical protein